MILLKKDVQKIILSFRPNDVVYIPPTILGRIGLAVQDVLFPTQPLQELGGTATSAEYNALGFGATRVGTTDRSRRGYRGGFR